RVVGATALANSAGFHGGYRGTYQSLVVEPICDDADGKKRNGHWWTADRFRARLDEPEAVGREAARRTVAKLGSEKIATGPLAVVFDPEAGRALLRLLFSVVSGGAIYRKSSYLLDREGSAIASPLVTIIDDPLIARGPGGFLIENGKLGRPVSEVTVSANFNELWHAVDAVGDDLDLRTSTACPTFRIAKMMIAGK